MGFVIVEQSGIGKLWAPREVPFQIKTTDFPVGSFGRAQVELAIQRWNEQAPHIPLVDKKPQHKDFVVFVQHKAVCKSEFGRKGGRQEIRCLLDESGADFGNVMHEIGHAVGLAHEHQRPDRDRFIDLIPENIPNIDEGFDPIDDGSFDPIGVYDYDSIMHYEVGSPPRFDPLRIDEQPGAVVGQRERLSDRDIQATLFLYGFRAPRTVTFSLTAVGDIKTRNVTIVNNLSRAIAIGTGPVSAGFFKVVKKFPATVAPFRTVSATLQFRPSAAGKTSATWSLTVAGVPVRVRVSGRASGSIEPQ